MTTRQLKSRLLKELERNVALRVAPVAGTDHLAVAGRGVLHLVVLIENLRREGYELSVGKPHVVLRRKNGVTQEPFESLVVEVPSEKLGPVMEIVGARRAVVEQMDVHGDYTYATFRIPARGLIGLRTRLLNATQGTAIIHHRFAGYGPMEGEIARRPNGVLVSMVAGRAVAYALDGLQQRAELFVKPNDEVYEGMIVGENSRENDLVVNPAKEKKLTNIRAAGSDDNVMLKPARELTLEWTLEYIEEDELVEVTPKRVRLRKILLKETERRRQGRARRFESNGHHVAAASSAGGRSFRPALRANALDGAEAPSQGRGGGIPPPRTQVHHRTNCRFNLSSTKRIPTANMPKAMEAAHMMIV